MPEIEILLSGYTFNADQTRMGLSTVTLIRGRQLTLVDVAHFGRRNMLVEALEKRGIALSDVARVVLTHAHWDHSQNTDIFPNAEIVIHEKELEYTHNPRPGDYATARYFADTLREQKVRTINKETELEPGVNLIETPGHSRGHMSVVVQTAGGMVCIGGDAVSDAGTVGRGTPAIIFWSEDEARESVRKVLTAASVIYPGHDRPFRVSATGVIDYLVEAPTIKFTGILDYNGNTFSVDVALAGNRGTTIHPDARSKAAAH
ncbi:MAG: N-acyl homoserine lactonase family protein [Dehalococcoidia bacterium]|nr:N-acyl homoserine lactonase family protein [Dehalococcoidia bacterium]MSQ17668.1 N-acyl homoserine lactonase family protein [Dehalococcoidia bacterium]